MLLGSKAVVRDGCTVTRFVLVDSETLKPAPLQPVAGFSELKMLLNHESSLKAIVY